MSSIVNGESGSKVQWETIHAIMGNNNMIIKIKQMLYVLCIKKGAIFDVLIILILDVL